MNKNIVDARGTNQEQARVMLSELQQKEFSGNNNELALALGRDVEEIEKLLNSNDILDDDLVMKMRGLAQQSETEIE